MLTKEERIENVKKFQDACLKASFKEVAPHIFELQGSFSKTLALCTLVHGNEIGGIEVFLNLLEEISSKKLIPKSNLRIMLGNVDAYFEDKRFLETDMNRSFDLHEPQTKEELRAKELEKFLSSSDVFIDIHQTIGPSTTPFFIFEYEERSYNFARLLHPSLPLITYTKTRAFKGKTSTGHVISKGGMGVTIETGQKGIDHSQISLGLEIVRKAIKTDFEIALPSFSISSTYTFSQIIHNPDGNLELLKKYNNFDPVEKEEILARYMEQEVRSEVDGVILFPKYGAYAKASVELALILKPVKSREEL